MATWDGSYQGPEEQNYFPRSDLNRAGQSGNWGYYNDGNSFVQGGTFYAQNQGAMYEQGASGPFYQMSSAGVQQNLAPVGNGYQSASAQPSSSQCFYENNRQGRNESYRYNGRNYNRKSRDNRDGKHSVQQRSSNARSDVIGQSNLDATANEFVPYGKKSEERNIEDGGKNEVDVEPATSASSDHVSQDVSAGRDRQERKYKKDKSYKQKEGWDNSNGKNSPYKDNYRTQNKSYGKYQNDRYFSNKSYVSKFHRDTQHVDGKKAMRDASVSSDTNPGSSKHSNPEIDQTETNTSVTENSSMNDIGSQESTLIRDNAEQDNRSKRYNNYGNEFRNYRYNSNFGKPQNARGNARRYPDTNKRNDRYENNYKRNNQDQDSISNQDHNTYRGSYNKENRNERFKEKNRNRDVAQESKDKVVENWRSNSESNDKAGSQKRGLNKKYKIDDAANQRERLAEQLNRGQLECLVCCEFIKQIEYVWSCSNCYHVLHLKCIKKWAKSSQADNGWRCPACQNVNSIMPEEYFCFCGKTKTPEWNRRDVAHSCGEICGRVLSKNSCVHKCTLLCHPGSCPPCEAMVTKYCGCGKMSQTLQCSTSTLLLCDSVCDKELNCGKHRCEKKCHYGECEPCEKLLQQECYCGKNTREVTCEADVPSTYSCGDVCGAVLNCGNHNCKQLCHPESCEPCSLTPDKVTTCCCGQTLLTEERHSCLDPIPTCDKICSKPLKCGQPSNPHRCKANCHEGDCPDCDLTTDVKCRCGNMDREIACKDLQSKADDARCEKKCIKKRSCGKHKCNQLCCIDIEHICPLPCSKTLSCGRHKCEQTCHKGRCQPCWRSSFDELYCECGAAVIYPPVPCGTRRPACDRPCTRQHSCEHEVLHNCHSDPTCPPCTVLTQRWCYGRHELRKAVPCHFTELSCGLSCNKPLSCGRHKCITICHSGPCERPGQQCTQPCTTPRELCGHVCGAPCHDDKCPDTPCKEMVKVTCQCGNRTSTRVCAENAREYQQIASSILASKMADMQLGHTVDLEEVFGQGARKQNQLKTLECNDECKLIERNRRLALGFQIVNPDLSAKLMPRYSEFMKQWARKDPAFCQTVHEKLTELVQLAKNSKQKSRSYSFECMNREKRQFVHESCEHFGCESQAYDREPKRNIVATAVKEKCWLPSYSLLEIVQRENGQRKVPGPMLNTPKNNSSTKTVLSLPAKKS